MTNKQPSAPYLQEVKRTFLRHHAFESLLSEKHVQQKYLLCEEGTDLTLTDMSCDLTRLMMQPL